MQIDFESFAGVLLFAVIVSLLGQQAFLGLRCMLHKRAFFAAARHVGAHDLMLTRRMLVSSLNERHLRNMDIYRSYLQHAHRTPLFCPDDQAELHSLAGFYGFISDDERLTASSKDDLREFGNALTEFAKMAQLEKF